MSTDSKFVRSSGQCACGRNTYVYKLFKRLDEDILPYIEEFGIPAFDFATTHLLKIENNRYIITGVKRLKEIRVVLKDNTDATLEEFEAALKCYLE